MDMFNYFRKISEKSPSDYDEGILLETTVSDDFVSISESVVSLDISNLFIINEGYALHFKHQPMLAKQIFDMDAEVFVYLNEGIIGSLINGIRRIINGVFNFMKGLKNKVVGFMDRFKKDNDAWIAKYETPVSNRSNNYRGYSYEGRKWDVKYFEYKTFPDIYSDVKTNSEALVATMTDFFKIMDKNSPSQEEMNKAAEGLKAKYPKGFKDAAKESYEKSLGTKMDTLQDFFYKKGAGNEKITINGFSVVKPGEMVDHIKKANERIASAQENMTSVLDKVEELFKVLDDNKDKLDALDKRMEDEKNTKNESVEMYSRNFGLSSVFNEAKLRQGKTYTKEEVEKNKAAEAEKVKRIKDKIEAENKEKEKLKDAIADTDKKLKTEKGKDNTNDDTIQRLQKDIEDLRSKLSASDAEIEKLKSQKLDVEAETQEASEDEQKQSGSDDAASDSGDGGTEEGSKEEPQDDKASAAIKYSTELRQVINQAVDTWNMVISVYNKILGVHYALVKDSTSEFKYQLTKFVNETKA